MRLSCFGQITSLLELTLTHCEGVNMITSIDALSCSGQITSLLELTLNYCQGLQDNHKNCLLKASKEPFKVL
jgi:hypothetical protein